MLHYTVTVADAEGHYFDVSLNARLNPEQMRKPDGAVQLELNLPAWIPGSYLIREFARHIVTLHAAVNGLPCELEKINKDTWRLAIDPAPVSNAQIDLNANWRVYAWDLSVRGAHLDSSHGFFNGTSLFLCPVGFENEPIELNIQTPAECTRPDWKIACGLKPAAGNTRDTDGCSLLARGVAAKFHAENYDALIDHPVEMGELSVHSFVAHGVKHVIAVYGADDDLDLEKLATDLRPVCEAQIALFEPQTKKAPFEEYWFLVHATDNGYGGLEHRNSTALLCSREDLPQKGVNKAPKGYETFLGLCSHEYFHAWNVKRMKPAAFVPYRLGTEGYTRLLWIFEGFTSYYDDLILVRTGKMDEAAYLKALGKTIAHVLKNKGRLVQSAADSSFDAWTKYYRQDENACNAVVSYYTKGALIALCLDIHIRMQSDGKKCLDDAMRLMWNRHGDGLKGLGEDEFPSLVKEATGVDVADVVTQWAYRCSDLPLAERLQAVGYSIEPSAGDDTVFLGMTSQFKPEGMLVKSVLNASPAHCAGISAGDVLLALDGKKLTEANHKRRLAACKPGEKLNAIGFRAERLISFDLIAVAPAPSEWTIKKLDSADSICAAPWASA